jgi:hypothetical protein
MTAATKTSKPQITQGRQDRHTERTTKRDPVWFVVVFFVFCAASSPFGAAAQGERIAEVRVHGNHTTPDADILAISGLSIGGEATGSLLQDAERRLRASDRFESVELRRRYLSIADPSRVLVMIVVDEHPAVSQSDLTPGPMRKLASAGMWLPILHHADGYGFTYGVRYSLADAIGDRSRVSVPLSWGGERRVGVEAERQFDGPISLLRGGLSLYRRVNPHFDQPDTRTEARVEAERLLTGWLRAGAAGRIAQVGFGPDYDARHAATSVYTVVDTRLDPSFPRNAVHVRLAWERLFFSSPAGGTLALGAAAPGALGLYTTRAARWRVDARGYVGIGGSTVLALRGHLIRADRPLPLAEQSLLGGSESLRGYRTGHRAGDAMAAGTIELRQPLNSPLSVGRFGLKAFVDMGTTWNAGGRIGDQRFERGIGGGVYFGGGPFIVDLDVAWPEEGRPRAHFGLGVAF